LASKCAIMSVDGNGRGETVWKVFERSSFLTTGKSVTSVRGMTVGLTSDVVEFSSANAFSRSFLPFFLFLDVGESE